MGSYDINILSVEKAAQSFEEMGSYDLMNILPKIARKCKVNIETMNSFYDMYFDYVIPPNIDNIKEILLNYILQDKKMIPYIVLDLESKGTEPWAYYIPKDRPKDTIRLTLLERTKVIVDKGSKTLPLIMPRGQVIDIKSINLIDTKLVKSMYLTLKYYNDKREFTSSYKPYCNERITHSLEEKKYLIPIEFDIDTQEFISMVNNIYKIYPSIFYSKYQFMTITLLNNIILDFLKSLTIDDLNTNFITEIKKQRQTIIDTIGNQNSKANEIIKDYIIKDLIRMNDNKIYSQFLSEINIISYNDIFNKMDRKQIEYIMNKYSLLQMFKESMRLNICPHLQLIRKFRQERNINMRMKLYTEIKDGFISNVSETQKFHTCRRCKFNIICPHITTTWEMVMNNISEIEIREKLDSYRNKNDKSQYQDFCKICNEVLFDANYEEIQSETYRILYKDIFNYLWSQTLNIFATLKITPKINIFDFSSNVVYGILPIITRSKIPEINNEMNRYIEVDELNVKFKCYILLYIYAYILNMIRVSLDNPSMGYINIKLEEPIKGNNISNYANAMIERFTTIHRSLFNQLVAVDVGEMLITIYTELAKSNSVFSMKRSNNLEAAIFNEIIKNTIFNYSFNIALITDYINIDDSSNINIEEYESIVEKILGMKISAIARGTEINNYLKVYQPNYNISVVEKYKNIIKRNKIPLEEISNILKGRSIYSFQVYMDRYKSIANNKYNINDDKELKNLLEGEKKIKYIANIYYKVITSILNSTKKWKRRKYTNDLNLTAIFAEDGEPYKWNIIVYEDGTEITSGTGDLQKFKKIVNYKDETTGILKTDTYKNNLEKTKDSYKKKLKKLVFFNFYKIKCPETGIHDFKDLICTKCNLKENSTDNDYFKKYYDTFIKENNESDQNITEIFQESLITKPKTKAKWISNERSIIEVAQLVNQSRNVIESIGAMENRTLNDIKSNTNRPPLPNSLYDSQIMLSLSHYYWIVRKYNRIKYGRIDDPELEEFFKKNGVNLIDAVNHRREMPADLFVNYNNIISSVFDNNSIKYSKKYQCLLQMICDLIISISKINAYFKKIAKALMDYIIKMEILTSLGSDNFDRSLFRKVDTNIIDPQENTDFDLDLDDTKIDAEGMLSYEDVDIVNNT